MDFTLLILAVFFLVSIQQQQYEIAAGIFHVILFATRNRFLILGSFVIAIVAVVVFGYHYPSWLIIAVLTMFFILLARREQRSPPGPESYIPESPI